jgi:hypothetical protein
MKLEKILGILNAFEKNSFLKIIDSIISDKPKNSQAIDKVLSDCSRDLKSMDNINVTNVFNLVEDEFFEFMQGEFANTTSQLDILTDIIIRDGSCIMKQDWFARIYEKELDSLNRKLKDFQKSLEDEKTIISEQRRRDYRIYQACLNTAYENDKVNNLDRKITMDEQSILHTLSKELMLSLEDKKLIKYLILKPEKLSIETVIDNLKSIGVIFFSKKTNTIYVADEVVKVLRRVRQKDIADKYYRRILRLLREPQLNLICKQHNIDWHIGFDEKIVEIINKGISLSEILITDIHKEGTNIADKKKFINEFCDKELQINPPLKGVVIEDKIANLIKYFEDVEKDEKIGISVDGYEKLLTELDELLPELNQKLKKQFELQDEKVLRSSYLLDYNLKPRDILEILNNEELTIFCQAKQIKTRGDIILNILDAYKDAENLYLENYENIGFRDLIALKANGLTIKEADLGIKFEDLTKKIFASLGFDVDENLRKKLNTDKDKIDILLNLGNNDLILIECKTVKESGYDKFSSVSRQLKAYTDLAKFNNFKVIKSLLVAPDFSDAFIKDCGYGYELNLSLIKASSLIKILEGFKKSKHKQFPYNLLMRDVLIQEEIVLKAIDR